MLAACNTGTGKNMRGEGVFSLARGFAAAGIPSSITTLWPIDNQSTYQLTELFYKYINHGLKSDEALREAKMEFLSSHDKLYQLPYFWAASILIGKPESFEENHKNHLSYIPSLIAGTLLMLFAFSAFLFYRKKRCKLTSKWANFLGVPQSLSKNLIYYLLRMVLIIASCIMATLVSFNLS